MYDVFGEDFVREYQRQHPTDWAKIMFCFEHQKRLAGPQSKMSLLVNIAFSFCSLYRKMKVLFEQTIAHAYIP